MDSKDLMDRAESLFDTGDNRSAKRLAKQLLADGGDDEKRRSRELLSRIGVDPFVYVPVAIACMIWIIELVSM